MNARWTKKKRLLGIAAKARAGKRLKLAATRASQADDGDVSEVSLALPRNDSEQDDETIDDTTFLKMMP